MIAGLFFNRLNGQVDFVVKDPGVGRVPRHGCLAWQHSSTRRTTSLTKVHANKAISRQVDRDKRPCHHRIPIILIRLRRRGDIQQRGRASLVASTCSRSTARPSRIASVQDIAGNHLDGEFYGSFPSGNGVNGSDFVAELQAVPQQDFRAPDDYRHRQRG